MVSAFVKLFAESANVYKYDIDLNGGGTDGSWRDGISGSKYQMTSAPLPPLTGSSC